MKMEASSVVRLPDADTGLQQSIIRFHNSRIDSKRSDPGRFYRRDAIVIINPSNKAKIVRFAMGCAGGLSITKSQFAIDYDGVDALGIKFKTPVGLIVRNARLYEVIAWYWSHPDIQVQLSTRLSVLGVVLGAVGLLTGLISLI